MFHLDGYFHLFNIRRTSPEEAEKKCKQYNKNGTRQDKSRETELSRKTDKTREKDLKWKEGNSNFFLNLAILHAAP